MSIKRKLFQDINVGEKATFSKTLTEADMFAFSGITGDFNPIHVDAEFSKNSIFKRRVIHGMMTSGMINTTLTLLHGSGGIHLSQMLKFTAPVFIGDTVTVNSEVISKDPGKDRITIKSTLVKQDGTVVIEGESLLLIPREKN